MSTPRRLESGGKPLLTVLLSLLILSLPFCKKNSEDNMFLMLAALTSGQAANPTNPGGVITPQFNPTAGTYSADQAVTITSPTSGATIHYTTDGTTPTAASATYSAPISVAGDGATMTIQAIAIKAGMTESAVASAGYVINYGQVSTPQFSPAAGTYSSNQSVTITTSTVGAAIHYTTDGTTPTAASATYTVPISVAGDGTAMTIKAIAVKAGMTDSTVASGDYVINYPLPAQPTGLTATGGNRQITLSWTAVSGATSYNLYWSTAPGVTTASGTKIAGVTFPYTHTGRTNGTDYHYIVTAVDAVGEGQASAEATAYPYLSPLKSYQTQCWDAAGALIACAGTGQDGESQAGRAANFTGPTDAGGGEYITTDNATGLVWKTCSEGLSGPTCATGAAATMSWATATGTGTGCDALNGGTGYAGRIDWRLPSAAELQSIINYGGGNPATFTATFPATQLLYYWSASTNPSVVNYAYAVVFGNGSLNLANADPMFSSNVRCVSSGWSVSAAPYNNNGDGTVTDRRTGLIWQRCSAGQNSDAACSGGSLLYLRSDALNYCNGLTLAGRSWRLPNVNELNSIVDTSLTPSIDSSIFPGTSFGGYWTSSTYIQNPARFWVISFSNGSVSTNQTNMLIVRCVSSGP